MKYQYSGRVFEDKDFDILDLNLFGGSHRGLLKNGNVWISVVEHPCDDEQLAEIVEKDNKEVFDEEKQ